MNKNQREFKLVTTAMCVTAVLFVVGCSPAGVQTTSYYNSQVGTSSVQTPDVTAVTSVGAGLLDPNTEGCIADGGLQPPFFPGWGYIGSSPGVGKCSLPHHAPGTWYFDFFSGQCAGSGQPFDINGIMSTDSSGHISQTVCTIAATAAPAAGSHFAISGALPSTVTVGASGLTQTNGMPQLLVYNSSLNSVTSVAATSVAGDGSSATFPFPAGLVGGTYEFAVKNLAASGQFKIVDATYYSIGQTTSLAGAFGTDAGDETIDEWWCTPGTRGTKCQAGTTQTSHAVIPQPLFTQYYANQATYSGHTFPVGTQPVAIKAYGTSTVINPNLYYDRRTTRQPARAIVANLGSSNVSILDLVGGTVLATIAVGSQPIAVTVNPTDTKAYVANYGSGTVSEVDLSTNTVLRTVTVGAGAQGVAMDPGGSSVWVGGPNYLKQISLSTFTVVATNPIVGTVTSLAASNAQNELVYTLVQNCCSASSSYSANEMLVSNMSSPGTYAHGAAAQYATYTMNGTLPSAATIPHATAVSAQFGNGMAASATPTGFVVYDVVSHKQLMSGTTPTPVRGISSDPNNTVVYLTVPDSNEFLTVPVPHL